jgi:hypothetical protein
VETKECLIDASVKFHKQMNEICKMLDFKKIDSVQLQYLLGEAIKALAADFQFCCNIKE